MDSMDSIFEKLVTNSLDLYCNKKSLEEIDDINELKNINCSYNYVMKKDIEELDLKKGTNVKIKFLIKKSDCKQNSENDVIICFYKINCDNVKNYRIIDIEELKPLIDSYSIENSMFFGIITKNLNIDKLSNEDFGFYNDLKEVFYREIDDKTINYYNEKYIIEIAQKLKKQKNINLFLGNGISLDFGADSWNKLSDNLFDHLNPIYINNVDNVKTIIGNNNYSNTLLVKTIFPNYKQALHNCIYKKYTKIHPNNSTMRAVSTFLNKYQNTNVITYNYDEFLERDIKTNFKKIFAIAKFEGGKFPEINNQNSNINNLRSGIVINHVHGFVPYNIGNWNPNMERSIILNQLEYFDLYGSKKNWGYKIQYEALKKGTCVFVGSSLSDILLVKLLNETKANGKRYAFMCGGNITPKDKYNVTKYYKELNVNIIWCNDFKEIHDILVKFTKLWLFKGLF